MDRRKMHNIFEAHVPSKETDERIMLVNKNQH
jgi:hypothetical protein